MTGDVVIRRGTSSDSQAVGDVFSRARPRTAPDLASMFTEAEVRAYLADLLRNPSCTVWVAQHRDGIVGFIVLREQWVDHLYVRPEWWRRGVGTRLLERAKQASPGGLRLFCFRCSRAARAFYRARGLLVERVCNADGEPDVEYRWAGDQGAVPPGSRTGHGSAGVR